MKKLNSQCLPALMLALMLFFAAGCVNIDNAPDSKTDSTKTENSKTDDSDEQTETDDAKSKEDSKTEKKSEDKEATDEKEEKASKETKTEVEKPGSNGPTAIKFDKGKSSKTMNVSLKGDESRKFTIDVGKGQVINVTLQGEGEKSASVNLLNGKDGVDNWEDGFGYLSILTGRKGIYTIEIKAQNGKNLSFPMKVAVTNNPDDYEGGIQ